MKYQLRIAGKHHKELYQHLFPGDDKEAVAIILCGRHESRELSILLAHEILLIPYGQCKRKLDEVTWATNFILGFLELVEKQNFGIVKIHSHPSGHDKFSEIDDISDNDFFFTVFNWSEGDLVHGSAIMMPDGRIIGRAITKELNKISFDKISVNGDKIRIWEPSIGDHKDDKDFSIRNRQVLGEGTYSLLKRLRIGVVGCSGTGSPTIEQLYRLGVGELVLVDPKIVEKKNINRVIQSTMEDAEHKRFKTDILDTFIQKVGIGTRVYPFHSNLFQSKETILNLIRCDLIFGCVDGVEGKHLLSQLANFYLIPYFDMGVQLNADGLGGIQGISAMVHYIQPGLSTLLSRRFYSPELLEAEGLARKDPLEYNQRLQEGYIRNANVERPAVLPVNMMISSMAVMDFLNRIHQTSIKEDAADTYARIMIDYSANCIENEKEHKFPIDQASALFTGRGDCRPFLRMTELDRLWNR